MALLASQARATSDGMMEVYSKLVLVVVAMWPGFNSAETATFGRALHKAGQTAPCDGALSAPCFCRLKPL